MRTGKNGAASKSAIPKSHTPIDLARLGQVKQNAQGRSRNAGRRLEGRAGANSGEFRPEGGVNRRSPGEVPKKKVAPGQGKATFKTSNKRADHTASAKKIIEGRSTSTDIQRQRALELLRASPQTTYGFRRLGISHPAQRLKELIQAGHSITSTRVTAIDSDGFTHVGVALYSLDPSAPPRQAAFDLGDA